MELVQLLRAVEGRHHYRGWDNSPRMLYAVLLHPWNHDEIVVGMEILSAMNAPPVAHILVYEGWWREFASQAELAAEDRLYADIAGSLECRFAIAVSAHETVRLCRIRGRQPELVASDSPLGSGMVASLRALHQATLDLYPAVSSRL